MMRRLNIYPIALSLLDALTPTLPCAITCRTATEYRKTQFCRLFVNWPRLKRQLRRAIAMSCPQCGSKLSTEHLGSRQTACPLCLTSLLSKTDLKRIAALKERIRRAMEKKRLAALKRKNKGKVKWLVKVEVHC